MTHDEIALLRAYAEERSEAAFAQLVKQRLGLVYGVALRRVGGDAHLAQDIIQKVFTALAQQAHPLMKRSTLGGWLYQVAHCTAVDAVRSEQRRRTREQHAPTMEQAADHTSAGTDWHQLRPVLDEALNSLHERDRDAVALRFFDEQSFAEIGRRLQLSEEAARKRVDRALDKLSGFLRQRGVTSTTAAVSLVLAESAAFAAPTGLASTVTHTAIAAAGSGTAWSFLGLSAGKMSLALGAISLAAIGAAWCAELSSNRAARELAALQATAAQLEQRLAASEQRAQSAEEDNAKLLAAIEAARRSVSAPEKSRRPENVAEAEKSSETTGEPRVHLRMIQLTRKSGEDDASLATKANTILARLRRGEDFAALANEFSGDSRSQKGGDWGWQKPSDLKGFARDAAFGLKKGEASAPILLPEGCFILFAEDRKG